MQCLISIALFMTASPPPTEEISSIARGGLLYDNWSKVLDKAAPSTRNPVYPKTGKYAGKDDYRCKECHGWDYLGAGGAYAAGDHATGIAGINESAGKPTAAIAAILDDKNHGFGKLLGKKELEDLALFVSKGQIDVDQVIDRKTKQANGNAANGAKYYNTICAKCHGLDGKADPKADPLGPLSRKNPWETIHKILNGQPASEMPAMRAFELQVSVDILAYTQTLAD